MPQGLAGMNVAKRAGRARWGVMPMVTILLVAAVMNSFVTTSSTG